MKPIPAEFSKNGYDYRLAERQGNVAIYEQSQAGQTRAFEVAVIRERKERPSPDGKGTLPAQEVYPSDSQWGVSGWTYSLFGSQLTREQALENARAKMDTLLGT